MEWILYLFVFSAWRFVKWIGNGVFLALLDFSVASWYNRWNDRMILHAFEHDSCLEPDITQEEMIYCEDVIKKLRRIIKPAPNHNSYHIIVRNHRTGKTTVVRQSAREVEIGVIYVDAPSKLDEFLDNLEMAISFNEYLPLSISVKQRTRGENKSGFLVSNLPSKEELENTRHNSNVNPQQHYCVIVFVSSERSVSRMMMHLTNEDALTFLCKLDIEKKYANQLIELVGGRICDLKTYGDEIKTGKTFEEIREAVFSTVESNFLKAKMVAGGNNQVIDNVVIQELLKMKKSILKNSSSLSIT
ncbi:4464_t:CDS:2 [Funneliformis geosporum]|uniref:4464_t:CDS:1 n=1 Tax=Funneliformis geosporum TaxID=1117311 RepID=A0A9W4WKE2_9GLOM|nr:4464_t:CDS:2 [Funneliformis geosporum]